MITFDRTPEHRLELSQELCIPPVGTSRATPFEDVVLCQLQIIGGTVRHHGFLVVRGGEDL